MFTTISVVSCSRDVIHSWAVPGLNVKIDCVPGRSAMHALMIRRTGIYYGQCSEVCGRKHFMMPIMLHAMDSNKFVLWWEHFILERFRKKLILKKKSEFSQNEEFYSSIGLSTSEDLEQYLSYNGVEQYSAKYH